MECSRDNAVGLRYESVVKIIPPIRNGRQECLLKEAHYTFVRAAGQIGSPQFLAHELKC
jgi:hypothetical protein